MDNFISDLPFIKLPTEKQKILIVDDDTSILDLLDHFLQRKGFDCKCAENGKKALELLEASPFTIVITDLIMPQIDGMELLKIVKESWPDTDVIVMTGYTKNFTYTDVIRAGASDFVQKPFTLDEIEAKLQRLIKERQLRHTLKRLSVRDGLTDLFNRRFFDHKLKEEVTRALRQKYPLYLLLLDIDKFKEVNDMQGHQEGDKVLVTLADTLKSSTRDHVDLLFRFGGDEFAVLIPYASEDQAVAIAERIRSNFLNKVSSDVTISMGLAKIDPSLKDPEKTKKKLFLDADEALYSAKKDGGNKLVIKGSHTTKD
ncbi:MAG: diguanylate cyclase [Thermodesulfobacteria bacterium]|nr:diguanylate cyclase [Thermodesulfobacteriota bacterium]